MYCMTLISRALVSCTTLRPSRSAAAAAVAAATINTSSASTYMAVPLRRRHAENKSSALHPPPAASTSDRTFNSANNGSDGVVGATRTNSDGEAAAPPSVPPPPSSAAVNGGDLSRLQSFKRFYDMVSNTREAAFLPPTPMGHAGSERILNNDLLHCCPWQASCVELRERRADAEAEADSSGEWCYSNIDFSSLRRQNRSSAAAASSCTSRCYAHEDDSEASSSAAHCHSGGGGGAGLEVVHYFETSVPAGLLGYRHIAMQVRKGLLPGNCVNYSAEGGFAVWVVPHREYVDWVEGTLQLRE